MTPVRALLALVTAVACVDAYKILVIFPMPGKSHGILGDGVVRHLLNAGHEVWTWFCFQYNISLRDNS